VSVAPAASRCDPITFFNTADFWQSRLKMDHVSRITMANPALIVHTAPSSAAIFDLFKTVLDFADPAWHE
jgi:hypothetical protein